MDPQQLWQYVLSELQTTLSKASHAMWLRDTFIADDTGDTIVIGVPSTFYLDWIRGKYHKHIADALRKQRPTLREVTYKVATQQPAPPIELKAEPINAADLSADTSRRAKSKLKPASYEPALDYEIEAPTFTASTGSTPTSPSGASIPTTPAGHNILDPARTFESFIVGNSNRLAHAVSLAAAQEPGKKYNPLFLYGGVGLGKTHLAQAIGNEIRRQQPNSKITYVSCETFTNEFIESLRKKDIDAFKKRYRQSDVLLIDDVQFMSGKEQTQEEFFHTFNALHQAKKQIVLTSDREPKDIPAMEDRLTSRFAWGMVADIQPPDLETRMAIIQAKCLEHGYQIEPDAVLALAQRAPSSIRELEGALQGIVTRAQVENRPVDQEYVIKVYGAAIPQTRGRGVNGPRIIEIVSEFFEIKSDEILGPRRYKELVYPRQLAMYLLRHELSYSYPKIGKELGGKDHTTIMHGVEKIEKELARNSNIQYDLAKLKERLHQEL